MNVEENGLEKIIYNYYKEEKFFLTKRIMERLVTALCNMSVLRRGESVGKDVILRFLNDENIKVFIMERQPYMEPIPGIVIDNIKKYFLKESLPYNPIEVYRKSNHRDYKNFYAVVAEGYDGKFACWTTWNDSAQSLNYGNYGFEAKEDAEKILAEEFMDITDEPEKYGMELTKREIEKDYEQISVKYHSRRGR